MIPTSVKLSNDGKVFLRRLASNRVKADMELQTLGLSGSFDIVVKYFKSNNDEYTDMIHTEVKK